MTREDVHSLIDNREGISVELKTCRQQVDHTVYETVCAFLNRLGGTIVMGVQDDGTIHQHLWAEMKSEENPMLSHVFGMMNYYEGVGKGMARLREYLWRYNANACVEFENSDLFRLNVILPESEIQGPQSETQGPQSRPQSETEGPQSRPQSEEQGPLSETTGDRMGLQDKILTLLYYEAEMSRSQLADNLGITPDTGSFRRTMKSLLEQVQIEHTDPEHPNSRFQKYRLSENARSQFALKLGAK